MAAMEYTLLFRIECLHGYFGGGPCRSLDVSPTEDCRQIMDRYRMLFRSQVGGGIVYGPKESPPDLLKQFDEIAPLTFSLTSNDPALGNYTQVNPRKADPRETIFYFDNRVDYAQGNSGQPCQLYGHKPLAQAAIPIRQKMCTITSLRPGDLTITEPLSGETLQQGTLAAKRPLQLDLRKLPEGLYQRQIANKPPRRFYLTNQLPSRRWGVISIYAGGIRQVDGLPENCQVIERDGTVHPRIFVLSLEDRKTIWRYYIIPSDDKQDFSHFEVARTIKKGPVTTAAVENEALFAFKETVPIDGRTAWVFESNSPLPLLLCPTNAFSLTLRANKNGKSGQSAIRLPYPQPASLTMKQGTPPGQMCSEIFVYV